MMKFLIESLKVDFQNVKIFGLQDNIYFVNVLLLVDRVVPLEFIPKISAANNSTLSQSSFIYSMCTENQFMWSHSNIVN